jgi:hypothetical protein
MTRRNETHDVKAAAAQAAQLVQRLTCEGCAYLRGLRPKCDAEQAPAYRQPRETFHERCQHYAVKGHMARPAAPEPPPASRAAIAGEVAKRKHNRWRRAEA